MSFKRHTNNLEGKSGGHHEGFPHVISAAMGIQPGLWDHLAANKEDKNLKDVYCKAILSALGLMGDAGAKKELMSDLEDTLKKQ